MEKCPDNLSLDEFDITVASNIIEMANPSIQHFAKVQYQQDPILED